MFQVILKNFRRFSVVDTYGNSLSQPPITFPARFGRRGAHLKGSYVGSSAPQRDVPRMIALSRAAVCWSNNCLKL
jgi:hypothetical protein